MAKMAKTHADKAKVRLRRAKTMGMADLNKKKSSIPEDSLLRLDKYVRNIRHQQTPGEPGLHFQMQNMVTKHDDSIATLLKAKDKELKSS